ncbi:MAG TPA: hypothetical protein VN493_29015 [Thermoanaerobaculia bacterium]|nr:hypothetical protein [Thermoanaerobaculia bacterium]
MKCHRQELGLVLIGLCVLLGASGVSAQTSDIGFFGNKTPQEIAAESANKIAHPPGVLTCRGPVRLMTDVAFEGFRFTAFNFNPANGGGEGGCFDPTPVLSTTVSLPQGTTCLNAHFSAIVGSRQTYGPALANLAVFQVTLTPVGAAPQHMIGHYETPYGLACPAIGIEAERDVDTFGSNFFQRVGTQPGDLPPGNYRVDVWWAGAPPFGAGGAFAGAFVLKLYGN